MGHVLKNRQMWLGVLVGQLHALPRVAGDFFFYLIHDFVIDFFLRP
jgi:hypothetical protein